MRRAKVIVHAFDGELDLKGLARQQEIRSPGSPSFGNAQGVVVILRAVRGRRVDVCVAAQTARELTEGQSNDIRGFTGIYRERVAVTTKLAAELDEFLNKYPWPRDGSITELGVTVNYIRSFVLEIRDAIKEEAERRERDQRTTERKTYYDDEATEPNLL
jgi:hypothetical protein